MAVAFDAATEIAAGATANPTTGTHTPSGTPKGVEVFITHAGSTDIITGVTYGGQALTRLRAEFDSTGEDNAAYQYFLGTGIPTGAQTVSVARSEATTPIHVVSRSLTGSADIEVVDTDGGHGSPDVQNPSVTLQTTGRTCIAVGGMFSGNGTIANVTDLGTQTRDADHDFGANTSFASRQSTPGTSDFTFGYTTNAVSSYALIASLFSEAQAHTRFYFYLNETDIDGLAPLVDTLWDRTADTSFQRQPALNDPTGFDVAGTNENLFNSTATSNQVYHQSISSALDVDQTISGTFTIAIRAVQSGGAGAGNGHLAISLRVVRPDGNQRGVLLRILDSSGTEFANSYTSRVFSNVALSSVAAKAGDRIVLEIGVHADTPPADTTFGFAVNQGAGIPELTSVEGVTAANTPWWELSQAITFAPADSVFGSATIVGSLSPFASGGSATLKFVASGAPVKTLSAFSSGTASATEGFVGSGSPVATLSPFSDGVGVVTGGGSIHASGSPVTSLKPFAKTLGLPRKKAKGGSMRFLHYPEPEKPVEKPKPQPKPKPIPEASELEDARVDLTTFSPIQLDPAMLRRPNVRLREPVPPKEAPKSTMSVEDRLLQHFIQSMLGPGGLASLDDDESLPYELRRFLRQGR